MWLGDKPTRQVKSNIIYRGDNLGIMKELEYRKNKVPFLEFCKISQADNVVIVRQEVALLCRKLDNKC